MIAVVQRVHSAGVTVDDRLVGRIGVGLCVLAAVLKDDDDASLKWTAEKIAALRVFPNGDAAYDLDVKAVGGGLLLVSNFTVAADTRRGRRPGFDAAMPPAEARPLFDRFVQFARATGVPVQTGEFGADMRVAIENDGPLTLVVRSPDKASA